MSIPYSSVPAGYYNRQGSIIGEFNRVAAQYGSPLSTGFNSIWAGFASSDQAAVQNLPAAVSSFQNSGQQYQQTLQQDGAQASILQVSDYYNVVPATLQQSLIVLAQQMKIDSQTIQRAAIGNTVTAAGTNLGNAKVIFSAVDPFGQVISAAYAETLTITCINSGTAFRETLQVVGAAQVPTNSYLWPAGSGANVQFAINDPLTNGLVTDGGPNNWGGTGNNTPTNWTIVNGSAGVTVFRSSSPLRGTFAAQLTSDGTSLTALAQTINAQINTVYAVSVEAKINSTTATGNFMIALTDGDGNILNDDAGNALSSSVGVNGGSGVDTSYKIFTAFFSTPRQLPTTTRVQYGFGTTAPTSGRNLTMNLLGIVAATQLYTGGPYMAAFSESNATAFGDSWTCAVTNNLTSQSFAVGMNRLYNTLSLGINLPSALSPTISDTLVTH